MPNHLRYGRVIQSSVIIYSVFTINPQPIRVDHIIDRFWNKWRYEYLANLRETHKHYSTNKNQPFIQVNDVVLVHSDKTPRSICRMGVVTELIKGKMENNIRGAQVRLSNSSLLKRPVNKLCPIEYVRSNRQEPADAKNLTRSSREATEIGELRRKFAQWTMVEILVPNIWWEVWELLYENRCTTSLTSFIF